MAAAPVNAQVCPSRRAKASAAPCKCSHYNGQPAARHRDPAALSGFWGLIGAKVAGFGQKTGEVVCWFL